MQYVQVYLQLFQCSLLLKCAPQPKIEKNQNPLFWGFKVIRGHHCSHH